MLAYASNGMLVRIHATTGRGVNWNHFDSVSIGGFFFFNALNNCISSSRSPSRGENQEFLRYMMKVCRVRTHFISSFFCKKKKLGTFRVCGKLWIRLIIFFKLIISFLARHWNSISRAELFTCDCLEKTALDPNKDRVNWCRPIFSRRWICLTLCCFVFFLHWICL